MTMTAAANPWKGVASRLRSSLGPGWTVTPHGPDGYTYVLRTPQGTLRMSVIATRADHDGQQWLHASIANPTRMPTWDELTAVKDAVIGPDRFAYQVLPPRPQWISIHEHCLHLWALWEGHDGRVLPDFAAESGWTSI